MGKSLTRKILEKHLEVGEYVPGKEIGIKVKGHAGSGKKDLDIVCAAVSAIIQTAVISVTKVISLRQKVKQNHGFLETRIAINKIEPAKLNDLFIILNSMQLGLKEILKSNPETLKIYFV